MDTGSVRRKSRRFKPHVSDLEPRLASLCLASTNAGKPETPHFPPEVRDILDKLSAARLNPTVIMSTTQTTATTHFVMDKEQAERYVERERSQGATVVDETPPTRTACHMKASKAGHEGDNLPIPALEGLAAELTDLRKRRDVDEDNWSIASTSSIDLVSDSDMDDVSSYYGNVSDVSPSD